MWVDRVDWLQSQSRRSVLSGLSALGLSTALRPATAFAEGSADPETPSVRFALFPGGTCVAPQFVAEQLLRAEGFSDFQTVSVGLNDTTASLMAEDAVDFSLDFASAFTIAVDAGIPMTALAGVHVGCYILFAREGINSILDLKGRSVGVGPILGSDPHVFVSAMATYVGLDPSKDIEWVVSEVTPLQLFMEGKIDALLSFPPEAQDLRQRKLGRIVVNSTVDRPWSQYFCCMALANSKYVQANPVATKRILRAVLKGADLCVTNPQAVARMLVEGGHAEPFGYDLVLEGLREIPYRPWREFDPEDTVRFFSLRLHEAGIIKSTPQSILARGGDWRILNELKRELKA